jgi:hypothetical protein
VQSSKRPSSKSFILSSFLSCCNLIVDFLAAALVGLAAVLEILAVVVFGAIFLADLKTDFEAVLLLVYFGILVLI